MSDVRPALYDRYVSTFKPENEQLTSADLAHYYQWCDRRYFPFLKELSKTASILELGCGHGRILNYLHQKGFSNVRGIDISTEQIALAKAQGLNAEREDIFDFFEDRHEKFDAIIAIDLFEHFTKEELLRLVPVIKSSLQTNGVLLVQTVNGEGLFPRQIIYGDITHMTVLTPGSMRQLLRSSGFDRMEFAECAPIVHGPIGTIRAALWKLVRWGANALRMIEAGKRQAVWTENFITVARA